MFRHLGVDVYGKGSCSDPGLTCDRKADDKCLQMLNTTYKVTPWLPVPCGPNFTLRDRLA